MSNRDRDALVNYWNIPIAPSTLPATSAPPQLPPTHSVATSKEDMCDLTAIDWSPDGLLLAVASYDSIMRILTASGELYMTDPVHKAPVFASKFSKSGKWLLTGSLDGTACVWNVPAKKLEIMYRCHIGALVLRIQCICSMQADMKIDCCLDVAWIEEDIFATCGADKLVHIVQVGTSNPLMSLAGHTNEVNSIEYNPKTQQLVSCSDDRTARIWSIEGLLKQVKDRKSNGVAKAIAPPKSDPQSAGGSPIPGFGADSTSTKNGEGEALPPCVVLRGHKNHVSTVDWCPRTPAGGHPMIATLVVFLLTQDE
jgi:transducin (beta)-like 1